MINFFHPPPAPSGGHSRRSPAEWTTRLKPPHVCARFRRLRRGLHRHVRAGGADAAYDGASTFDGIDAIGVATEAPSPASTSAIPDQVNPTAGRTFEAATPAYWVEYDAYNTPHYAIALRDQLHRSGIDTTIVERHRPGYARYLVRTPSSLGRDEAQSLAARGQSALGVQPLVGQMPGPAA